MRRAIIGLLILASGNPVWADPHPAPDAKPLPRASGTPKASPDSSHSDSDPKPLPNASPSPSPSPGGLKLPDRDRTLSDPGMEALFGYLISVEFEKKYLSKSEVVLPANSPETQYVRRIVDRLIRVVKLDRPDLQFEVKVVKSPEINALCIPGGHIYVYTGLLDMIKQKFPAGSQEEVLAAAVGHEMAHAVLRHTLQSWARSKDYEAVLTDTAVFRKLMLTTSRSQELEADRYGALYMLRAGYRVSAAIELFEKLPGSKSLESDHPTGGQRVRQLRTYFDQLQGLVDLWNEGLKAANAQNYSQARICFGALRAEFPQLPSVHNNLGWAYYALYQESQPDDKRSQQQVTYSFIPTLGITVRGGGADSALLNSAAEEFAEAIRLNPGQLSAYEGAAACALEAGNLKQAAELLEKANKIGAKDATLSNLWGVLRERQGNSAGAMTAYAEAAKIDSRYLPALFNMAGLYERQGKKTQAQQLLTKYIAADRSGYWYEQAKSRLQHMGVRVSTTTEPAGPMGVGRAVSAGGVKLGASPAEVQQLLGTPDDKQALKSGTEVYHYKRGIDVYFSSTGVVAVTLSSSGAGAVQGVKVGMTSEQLDQALGAPQATNHGDNGELLWSYPSIGLVVGVRDAQVSSIVIQR